MTIPPLETLSLDFIRGAAEILPISGSGHLALARMLEGGDAELVTSGLLDLGTLVATVYVVRTSAVRAIAEGLRGILRPSLLKETQGGRDAMVILLASIPMACLSLLLRGSAEVCATSATFVGTAFLCSALVVGSSYWAPKGEKDTPSSWGSLLVGIGQGVAVLPGLSRMAMAISALLWLGIRAERTFVLSLLVSLPAIACAASRGAPKAAPLVLGMGVTFVASLAALQLLRGVLLRRAAGIFAVYLVPLGIATLAWGYARPLGP